MTPPIPVMAENIVDGRRFDFSENLVWIDELLTLELGNEDRGLSPGRFYYRRLLGRIIFGIGEPKATIRTANRIG